MSQYVLGRLVATFPAAVTGTGSHQGDEWALVERDHIVEVCRFLRDAPDLDMKLPVDLTVVDRLGLPDGLRSGLRFEVVYHLASITRRHRVRLKVRLPEDDPTVPSVTGVFPGFGWFEREAYDMFGVHFAGHPDLRRILLYEEFQGHPLRKDYPHAGEQPRLPLREPPGEPPPERRVVPPWERD